MKRLLLVVLILQALIVLGCKSPRPLANTNVLKGRQSGYAVLNRDTTRLNGSDFHTRGRLGASNTNSIMNSKQPLSNQSAGSAIVETSYFDHDDGATKNQTRFQSESISDATAIDSEVDSLTLESAESLAIQNSPALRRARAEIQSLQGKYLQAGLRRNPSLGYLANDVGEEGTAGQQGGFVSQEIVTGNKLGLNRSVVCREIEVAKQELAIERQKLLTDVRTRFYDLLVAQQGMEIAGQFEELSRKAAIVSDRLYAAKEISKVADLRTRLQLQNIGVIVEQAKNALAAATRRLSTTMGFASSATDASNQLVVVGEVKPAELTADANTFFQKILSSSPEVARAAAQLETARWNLLRQNAGRRPNIQVQTGFTHGNVTGEDLVAVQVGVPLQIFDRNQGNISSARSDVTARIQNVEGVQRDLTQRFNIAWRDYVNARIQIKRFQDEIIPAAAEVYELVELGYREGELGYLDLVTAQQAYLDASLRNLNALREFWRAACLIEGNLLSKDQY